MIAVQFNYEEKKVAYIPDVAVLFKKDVWSKLEEAITQQVRHLLLHELSVLREDMESGGTTITCNFNKATGNFDFSFETSPDVADSIQKVLNKRNK